MQQELDSGRIKFIDGLRGIAVLMVVLFHFVFQQIALAGKINVSPVFLQHIFKHGNMGVYIFFVISGFIVSYVTFDKINDFTYIYKFILRRQIRLDPPFWLAVLVGVVLAVFSIKVLHNDVYLPGTVDIITNLTYVFDMLGRYDIIRVGWTLCLEIQFYLFYILLIYCLNKLRISGNGRNVFLYITFIGSLLSITFQKSDWSAFIINYWYAFFLGVAVAFHVKNTLSNRFYFLILITPLVFVLGGRNELPLIISAATSLLIFISLSLKRSNKWLSGNIIQFFGLISYSLYLTHCLIGNKIIRYLKDAFQWQATDVILTFLILLISFGISVIIAYIFFILIEKRSILWSKRLTIK